MSTIWTDELIADLRGLWDEGLSTSQIGRRLDISKNAVVGKAHRLGLPPRPSPIKRRPLQVVASTGGRPCAWPIGDPRNDDFHFCSHPAIVGKPYCAEHYSMAYIRESAKKRAGSAA